MRKNHGGIGKFFLDYLIKNILKIILHLKIFFYFLISNLEKIFKKTLFLFLMEFN